MNSAKKTARLAGLLYLIVVLTGIFNLLYVPSKLIDWNNASATFNNIIESETLFRLGLLAGIVCFVAFLFLPMVLYKLLSPVSKPHAVAMVALSAVSVPISLVNLLSKFAVLTLIGKEDYLNTIPPSELQTQVMLHLNYYNNGIHLASIFWGFWLFPLGYLVFKSGFLPKILGVFLMVGCFGYVINFVGSFLYPYYKELGVSNFVSLPASIGEIATCLWLLIVGVKKKVYSAF